MMSVLKKHNSWIALGFGVVLIAALVYILVYRSNLYADVPPLLSEVAVSPPLKVTSLHLTDHQRHMVTPERFSNHWTFVFFGYSNCPDVCPATLTQLVQINKMIRNTPILNGKIQFYFVSVDPERDTIPHLADYIGFFDKSFTAMTGDETAIRAFEKELGAYHRIEKKEKSDYYAVRHRSGRAFNGKVHATYGSCTGSETTGHVR